ncbi:TetR/AcrR family transcriptional regulator [Bradyrhizobium niftali]|uniref:TetR/AcrR family transcriptional regulator n=1 Tax=Bradyrhizobium niftali TaxID=2560055 RepID=A0A4Y9M8E8_9BRAD|nr:TetR/AcrR family transcriptional regulator [Bradyrhizobium niftali]TFV51295.1 TetR/AcrR family transcriptional regulator [Bradyrhizobium niftali]
MAKKSRTNEQWREESLETLYRSGVAVFSEKGFRGASLDEIAKLAGMSKAGLLFYFDNKDKYLAHILRRITAVYIDAAIARAKEEKDVVDRVVRFLHQQVSYSVKNQREIILFVLLSIELRNAESESGAIIAQKYKDMRDFIEEVVHEGIKTGRFSADVRLRETSSTFMAIHDGILLEWVRRGEELDGSELVRVFRRALLASLFPAQSRTAAHKLLTFQPEIANVRAPPVRKARRASDQ